jgi:predicted nucleic acid-binding protein
VGATLLAALEGGGHKAFVADTAPLVYRIERDVAPALSAVCDPLFDAVEAQALDCLVSAVSVTELMIAPYRAGPEQVSMVDAFLEQPALGIVDVGMRIAQDAARLIASAGLHRLPDALVAATAAAVGLPLVTSDRQLARSGVVEAFLVSDFASH